MTLSDLPLEMLETVLMRAFLMLYQRDFERDDDRGIPDKTKYQAFTLLASVCSFWHKTLSGWSHSPTGRWVRHQLKKLIEREY